MARVSDWTAPTAGVRWTEADGRAAVRAWKRSGLTLAEFERRHDLGAGKLSWWKRRIDGDSDGESIVFAPMLATGTSVSAVVVRVGEVEIEVRGELVPAEWLSAFVAGLATARARA